MSNNEVAITLPPHIYNLVESYANSLKVSVEEAIYDAVFSAATTHAFDSMSDEEVEEYHAEASEYAVVDVPVEFEDEEDNEIALGIVEW